MLVMFRAGVFRASGGPSPKTGTSLPYASQFELGLFGVLKLAAMLILALPFLFKQCITNFSVAYILGCVICVKMLKVQYVQWNFHCLTLVNAEITKILKKN